MLHRTFCLLKTELTSQTMRAEFEARGIQVETGIGGIKSIKQTREGLRLIYQRHGNEIALDVDAVIVAVGWTGNLETLRLEAAGVQTQRGYIVVNDSLQTTATNISAAGDITGRMMLVQSTTYQKD